MESNILEKWNHEVNRREAIKHSKVLDPSKLNKGEVMIKWAENLPNKKKRRNLKKPNCMYSGRTIAIPWNLRKKYNIDINKQTTRFCTIYEGV